MLAGAGARTALAAAGCVAAALWAACATGGGAGAESDPIDDGAASAGGGGDGGASSSSLSSGGAGGAGGAGGDTSCSESPCKLTAPQCGCEDNQACVLDGSDGTRECVLAGLTQEGEKCTIPCSAGLQCLGFGDAGDPATCHKFCTTDADCTSGPGAKCLLHIANGPNQWPEALCSWNCDPISATGCAVTDTKCDVGSVTTPAPAAFTLCRPAGAGTQGTTCATSNDCASGYGCINYNSLMFCARYCNVASPACGGSEQCAAADPPWTVGAVQYGACVTP